jgi:hypothetical protein
LFISGHNNKLFFATKENLTKWWQKKKKEGIDVRTQKNVTIKSKGKKPSHVITIEADFVVVVVVLPITAICKYSYFF